MFDSDNRGQVGIGTLIVFIAMVLVAAIAAGVLINTAGFLQAQAEATGEESAEQVSDRVEVVSVVGEADGEDNVTDLNVSVRRAAGADDIDLENVIIETFANGESATLTYNDTDPDASTFTVHEIQWSTENVLADSSDRAKLEINLEDSTAKLQEGDSVTLTITTAAGGTAFVEKRAPSTIEDGESYLL